MRYLLLFLLPLSLFGAKILSYNIYDRSDRADVMITFDTPYTGKIKQSTTATQIIIKLQDASIESSKVKKVNSNYLRSMSLNPMADYTQIVANVPNGVKLKASKTSDAYGLRLRFTTVATSQSQTQNPATSSNPLAALPTKKSDEFSQSYYIVIAIMIVGIIILFMLKRKITKAHAQNTNQPWLFEQNQQQQPAQQAPQQQAPHAKMPLTDSNEVSIRFQKTINESSNVVMLDFGDQSYLILMGRNNLLLDKFTDNKPQSQEDFEAILQSRHEELDEFLQVESNATQSTKDSLRNYKEKAASISYDM